jgi:hypothetical protein
MRECESVRKISRTHAKYNIFIFYKKTAPTKVRAEKSNKEIISLRNKNAIL